MSWYALQVRTNSEARVAQNLNSLVGTVNEILGVSTGLKKVVRITESGRKIAADVLYPGYIFVKVSNMSNRVWHAIKSLPLVQKILDSSALIDKEMERILEETIADVEITVSVATTETEIETSKSEMNVLEEGGQTGTPLQEVANNAEISPAPQESKTAKMIRFLKNVFSTTHKKGRISFRIPVDIYDDVIRYDDGILLKENKPLEVLKSIYLFCHHVVATMKDKRDERK